MSKITKYNVREHHSILRCFSHSTLIEKKVFMKIAHKLNSLKEKDYKNKDLLKLSIHVKELINNLATSYEALSNICNKLMKNTYTLDADVEINGNIETGILRGVFFPECFISNNYFQIKIMTTILPYFCRELKKYRNYNIIEAKFLKHKHSIEFYKFLKDQLNQNKKTLKISIEELKYNLGLESKYKQYSEFKKRVLEPAKQDLKDNSVLYFTYKEFKKGRRVTELRINIHESKDNQENIYLLARLDTYINNTPEYDFKKDFKDFLKNEYCYSKLSKQTIETDYQNELKKLKNKHSISDYPVNVQKQFINFLEPQLL